MSVEESCLARVMAFHSSINQSIACRESGEKILHHNALVPYISSSYLLFTNQTRSQRRSTGVRVRWIIWQLFDGLLFLVQGWSTTTTRSSPAACSGCPTVHCLFESQFSYFYFTSFYILILRGKLFLARWQASQPHK